MTLTSQIESGIAAMLNLGAVEDAAFTDPSAVVISERGFVSRKTFSNESGTALSKGARLCLWVSRLIDRFRGSGSYSSKHFAHLFQISVSSSKFEEALKNRFHAPRERLKAMEKIESLVVAYHRHLRARIQHTRASSKVRVHLMKQVHDLEAGLRIFYFAKRVHYVLGSRVHIPQIVAEGTAPDLWPNLDSRLALAPSTYSGPQRTASRPRTNLPTLEEVEERASRLAEQVRVEFEGYDRPTLEHRREAQQMTRGLDVSRLEKMIVTQIASRSHRK